ncbi:MAG: RNA polymerase sigma factor (sigma-70 family) [Verrucomicrobiales bacterium]|jgi:RNA polymerase sigma factor (sigma-70 family)
MDAMETSHALLRRFVAEQSEASFRALVERHGDLIYSTAYRCLRDSHAAEDVCQEVFALLVRNAERLLKIDSIEGWLYAQACRRASNWRRKERRRQRREEQAMSEANQMETDTAAWAEVALELESAMLGLPNVDQQVILLRFFQGLKHSEVAHTIGVTEEAARKRVTRALEKLRLKLERRGVVASGVPLGSLLLAHAVTLSPASAMLGITLSSLPVASGFSMGVWLSYFKTFI